MEQIPLPTRLDDPKIFLLFTMEDFMIFMGCMIFGVALHALGYFMLGGVLLSWAGSRFRGSMPDGLLQHAMYWYGIPIGKGPSLINPFIRRFIS